MNAVAYNHNGKQLCSAGSDKSIKIWQTKVKYDEICLDLKETEGNHICYSPDGKKLASGCDDRTIRVWNLSNF